jgi:hypothetical protein
MGKGRKEFSRVNCVTARSRDGRDKDRGSSTGKKETYHHALF